MSNEHEPAGYGQGTRGPSIPFDQLPDPLLRYVFEGDTPVVTATNGPFADTFETPAEGLAVVEWCRREGLSAITHSPEELPSAIRERTVVELGRKETHGHPNGVRYRVKPLASAQDGAGEGFLHFDTTDVAEEGVEVDRIASVISHDLRNPLDVAKARLQAARETGDPEHFDHLEKAHDRMERIIQDVLTLARGAGAINTEPEVAIGQVAKEAWTTVETENSSLEVDSDLPVTEADPNRLKRLFENLFRNSLEHGEIDGEDATDGVRIRVDPLEDGFLVADDGPGIPVEARETVFEPGYTSHENGTGLGLTIVDRIAEAHGWQIELTAARDGGARFEFRGLDVGTT